MISMNEIPAQTADENLTLHTINDENFLNFIGGCGACGFIRKRHCREQFRYESVIRLYKNKMVFLRHLTTPV
jgi:hypothetical protein